MQNLDCLFSTVRCIAATGQNFTFLPPHGKFMTPGEEYSMFGHVQAAIQTEAPGGNARKISGFLSAVNDGLIEIVSNPNPILENGLGQAKIVRIDRANNLSLSEPCWESLSIGN